MLRMFVTVVMPYSFLSFLLLEIFLISFKKKIVEMQNFGAFAAVHI